MIPVNMRWLIRRDMPEVLRIEQDTFPNPWSEEDFNCCLRQRHCVGMVAERDDHNLAGFIVYELHKTRIHVLNFAVAPEVRRHGIGSQMVQSLIGKLSQQRRKEIVLELRETNLDAQLFFKAQGFKALCVLAGYFEDNGEDAYIMEYLLDRDDPRRPWSPANRITNFLKDVT